MVSASRSKSDYHILYPGGNPVDGFNKEIIGWLGGMYDVKQKEKTQPRQTNEFFRQYIVLFQQKYHEYRTRGLGDRDALKGAMSNISSILNNKDVRKSIYDFYSDRFKFMQDEVARSKSISQAINNAIGYSFAKLVLYPISLYLSNQSRIIADIGVPESLKSIVRLNKQHILPNGQILKETISLDTDLAVFDRCDCSNAILFSLKTSQRERTAQQARNIQKTNMMYGKDRSLLYVFVGADLSDEIVTGKGNIRGTIVADAKTADYFFVSKSETDFVSNCLDYPKMSNNIFYTLGTLLDLIDMKYGSSLNINQNRKEGIQWRNYQTDGM